MNLNAIPAIDMSDSPTGCCPRFHPEGWDGQNLHFRDKPFIRATTRSLAHVPLNMDKVMTRVQTHIQAADAAIPEGYLMLSRDLSAWKGEHLIAVRGDVPEEEMVTLSGDFITRVFEGPYREVGKWHEAMQDEVRAMGREPGKIWFFYTTCPKCAKAYGKNYVVGVAETLAT